MGLRIAAGATADLLRTSFAGGSGFGAFITFDRLDRGAVGFPRENAPALCPLFPPLHHPALQCVTHTCYKATTPGGKSCSQLATAFPDALHVHGVRIVSTCDIEGLIADCEIRACLGCLVEI
eukprot:4598116-Amphidinium_carterae.1